MKEFTIKIYTPEEALNETIKRLENDVTIQDDQYYMNVLKRCKALDKNDDFYWEDTLEILAELERNHCADFMLIPDAIHDYLSRKLNLSDNAYYIETHAFD